MATCRLRNSAAPRLGRIRKAVSPAMEGVLSKIGNAIDKEIVENLSGRVLNVRSGRLRSSWFMPGPIVSRIVGGWRMMIGSNVPYARIHELGGMAGRGHKTKIPKRPYVRTALVSQAEKIRTELAGMWVKLSRLT